MEVKLLLTVVWEPWRKVSYKIVASFIIFTACVCLLLINHCAGWGLTPMYPSNPMGRSAAQSPNRCINDCRLPYQYVKNVILTRKKRWNIIRLKQILIRLSIETKHEHGVGALHYIKAVYIL